VWSRPSGGIDTAPIIAATLARWGWSTAPRYSAAIY
jgi:hypothetical protein